MSHRPGLGTVFWVSFWLAGAAVSALYLMAHAVDVVFAPFALVDWLARVAPGRSITFFIDTMVGALRVLSPTNLSSAAKTSEAAFGVVVVIAALTIAGAVMLRISPPQLLRTTTIAEMTVGIIAGGLLTVPIYAVGSTRGARDGIITVLVLAAWGLATGWSRHQIWIDAAGEATAAVDRRRFF